MGVVYAARDERLRRNVAVKMIGALSVTETTRKRFWREARAAASVNHPNICQVYEIGEDGDQLFIAMEYLEGEDLADRLLRGPMGVRETLRIGDEMLAALSALHERGIVHRDLKPSNVFLTNHGVKLLDFGVARPDLDQSVAPATGLTPTGMPIGTPRYMAPEVATGDGVDARSDLFAVGAILFEMLAGRPAFQGRTIIEVLHATLHEQPPALSGSPAVAAIDRVLRRALAKRPIERIPSADAMREELAAVRGVATDVDTPVVARTLTRIVVLPFRVLRPDPESDFLAFSLPDAIANSLSGIGSLVVRSSAVAARFAGETPDLKAIAADVDVDRVVMGTVLRSGQEVRAAAQLVEAPGGTLLSSLTVQASMDDLFRLQDDITRQVVEALSLPLAGVTTSAGADTPHDPRAYELYLRANELAQTYDGLIGARDLYQRCVELDPSFAPAWAHLGRCHRVIVKYIEGSPDGERKAEEALKRALQLNPRLSLAHRFYAMLEADLGQAREGVARLLGEARRHGNDPELFAGLVHTCRYCGLFDEGIAAHAEARRLDPNVPTSVGQTMLMTGDFSRVAGVEAPAVDPGADDALRVIAFGFMGMRAEAREILRNMQRPRNIPAFRSWTDNLLAWLERRAADMHGMEDLAPLRIVEDPEAVFQQGWLLCDEGAYGSGLEMMERAVAKGYYPATTLMVCAQFDEMRSESRFQALLANAQAGRQAALAAFRDAGGDALLGR
jgi:non-specific serine/threonine protein kinase